MEDADLAELSAHYARGEERERLGTGQGLLEFARTTEIILRRLPATPALVADIGGGPGRYALWLAGLGYRVEHRDLMPLHVRQLAQRLARDLDQTGHLARDCVVIHGDFTNHNVIADGTPPRATGVIDFAGAHVERPLADIGYGLWRSGRPRQEADHLDLDRIARFLRGYATVVPVSADEARSIPVYIRGRGLQMIAKRVRAGRAEAGMLAEVQWLSANAAATGDALAAAVG